MKKKSLLILVGSVIAFIGLVGYNYFVAQRNIQNTQASPLSVSLASYPDSVSVGHNSTFIWDVDAPPDLSTPHTAIFWGYTASPSALTKLDSPEAVGYPFRQDDYWQGSFKLPDTFTVSIKFEKPGVVYFRAYAKVGNEHLWSEEKSLVVNPVK